MGYERHILRNSKHGDDSSITLEEWMTYVATDPSLKTSGDDPMIFNWTEHPVGTIEGDLPWLHYRDGRISTRHPDEYLSLKMFEIAEKLNAQLGDDEGVFDEADRQELEGDVRRMMNRLKGKPVQKPWWKFWGY